MPFWMAFAVALVAGAVIAVVFYFGALVPAQRKGANHLGQVILTLGLALILQGLTVYRWGAEPDRFPFPLSDTKVWKVGPIFVSELALGTLAAAAAASLILYLITQKTRLGLAMRATSENLQAAQTLGIPTRGVLAFAWGVAAALAVVAGVFLAPVLLLDPFFMLDAMFKGLAAAVLGGLNSLPGRGAGRAHPGRGREPGRRLRVARVQDLAGLHPDRGRAAGAARGAARQGVPGAGVGRGLRAATLARTGPCKLQSPSRAGAAST